MNTPQSTTIQPATPEHRESAEKSNGVWGAIPTAAKIAGVFVLVAGTFFATRYSLQSEISEIKASMGANAPLDDHSRRTLILKSIANLRVIELELGRIGDAFRNYDPPQFVYAKASSQEAMEARQRNQVIHWFLPPEEQVVIGLKDSNGSWPSTLNISYLQFLVTDEGTRSINDTALAADLLDLTIELAAWNSLVYDSSQRADKMNLRQETTVTVGITKDQAVMFASRSTKIANRINGRLANLASRVKSEYGKLEQIGKQ